MQSAATEISNEAKRLGLEPYILALETDGLVVVPSEVTGVPAALFERCTDVLLAKFTQMTGGCPISLAEGPRGALRWPAPEPGQVRLAPKDAPPPSQMLIQQLLQLDRCFRDLFVNPVVDALIDHLVGRAPASGARMRRLSSTNSFVKWQGDYGYGPNLGLHCDQGANPLPWGSRALTANATWCLTEYSEALGALAYVPGSHRSNAHPGASAAKLAKPVVCPAGAVIVWPGATWHGAYPRLAPGLRLNAVAYYRHQAVLPQENMKVTMREEPWQDCADPERLRELIGFDDVFPYEAQNQPVPTLAAAA